MFLLGKSAPTPSPQSQASRWYPSAPSSNQPSLATPGVRTGCWLILAFPFKDLGARLGRNGQKPSGWKKQGFVCSGRYSGVGMIYNVSATLIIQPRIFSNIYVCVRLIQFHYPAGIMFLFSSSRDGKASQPVMAEYNCALPAGCWRSTWALVFVQTSIYIADKIDRGPKAENHNG